MSEPDLTPRPEVDLPPLDPEVPAITAPEQPKGLGRRLSVSLGLFLVMLALCLGSLVVFGIDIVTRQSQTTSDVQLNAEQIDAIIARSDERSRFRTDASCADLASDITLLKVLRQIKTLTPAQADAIDVSLGTKIELRRVQVCPPPPPKVPKPNRTARP